MKRITCLILSLILTFSLFAGCSQDTAYLTRNDASVCDTVDFHTDKQEEYINSSFTEIKKFAKGKKWLCKPEPIVISWSNKKPVSSYTVKISENSDMLNPSLYLSDTSTLSVYNLKVDTQYYWTYSYDGFTSDVFTFKTSDDCPRNIYVDGVKNVRDLGGWKTEDGRQINQGLVFRCARLNESSSSKPVIEITDDGINTMKNVLGIKSEIDLRKVDEGEIGAITSSPLGTDVNYYNCPMVWDGDILFDNKEQVIKVFDILSDRDNYPLIFHCNIGTDRTGMVAFLINALCGVSEDDLKRDYLFSNFADIGGQRKISNLENSGYYKGIMKASGRTLSEKTYNCLLEVGVPAEQLDAVKSIMLD